MQIVVRAEGPPSRKKAREGVGQPPNWEFHPAVWASPHGKSYGIDSIVPALAKSARACPERSRRDGAPAVSKREGKMNKAGPPVPSYLLKPKAGLSGPPAKLGIPSGRLDQPRPDEGVRPTQTVRLRAWGGGGARLRGIGRRGRSGGPFCGGTGGWCRGRRGAG